MKITDSYIGKFEFGCLGFTFRNEKHIVGVEIDTLSRMMKFKAGIFEISVYYDEIKQSLDEIKD